MKNASWIVAFLAVAVLVSCGSDERTEVFVSAAASLTDSFEAIEEGFEEQNPSVDIILNLAGSSTLREQILAGAPADVFASANESVMDEIADADLLASAATVFATNRLEVAVPPANPGAISGLGDFDREELVLGLCASGVPCGDFAIEALRIVGVDPMVDTYEPNVRSLLTKVESGDLDAGIVYYTDVLAAHDKVEGVPIPAETNVVARYPIAVLHSAADTGAAAFVAFVLSADGREILAENGFGTP